MFRSLRTVSETAPLFEPEGQERVLPLRDASASAYPLLHLTGTPPTNTGGVPTTVDLTDDEVQARPAAVKRQRRDRVPSEPKQLTADSRGAWRLIGKLIAKMRGCATRTILPRFAATEQRSNAGGRFIMGDGHFVVCCGGCGS